MFAPEGYMHLRELAGELDDAIERVLCAYQLEELGQDPSRAFLPHVDPARLLLHLAAWKVMGKDTPEDEVARSPENRKVWKVAFDAYRQGWFDYALAMNGILAKVLKDSDPVLCSNQGALVRLPDVLGMHMDRLDWCDFNWPFRDEPTFSEYYKGFDAGTFSERDLNDRFCFVDRVSGLIALKNNSLSGFSRACHFDLTDADLKRIETYLVRPFLGWSVAWNPKDLPDTGIEILHWYGWCKEDWNIAPLLGEENEKSRSMGRKRGRKPSSAKAEYFRRYPAGKPEGVSYEAIALELVEAGFPITARTLQNYEQERLFLSQ